MSSKCNLEKLSLINVQLTEPQFDKLLDFLGNSKIIR